MELLVSHKFPLVFLFLSTVSSCWYGLTFSFLFLYLQRAEEASDRLELELQIAVSLHAGAGNQTQVLCENKKHSSLLSHLSSSSASLSYTTQDHMARDGRTNVAGPSHFNPSSRTCPTDLPTGQSEGGVFSAEAPSSQIG